jgi:hypothetical protein
MNTLTETTDLVHRSESVPWLTWSEQTRAANGPERDQ